MDKSPTPNQLEALRDYADLVIASAQSDLAFTRLPSTPQHHATPAGLRAAI